jgi:transcriptional regulator with XRE-family HTH domain
MLENSIKVTPLNWRALVAEALRRRKAEKLTQREHAALASVSIPTIVAFDRGERTLSLAKAFDILRVVGLIEEPTEDGAQ